MNNAQKILVLTGLAIVAGLYFLGPTVDPNRKATQPAAMQADAGIDVNQVRMEAVAKLPSWQQQYLTSLENSVKRGDVKNDQRKAYQALTTFWHDSVGNPVLHYHYFAKLAELDNTEKSLTFAAHSILGYLPYAQSTKEQTWLATLGKELFEKALEQNPANDSTIVGLGGCIIYGAATGQEGGPMQGIMKVREVAQRDSNFMFAQYMLGVGGVISGQYDKAAQRFERVVKAQPNNMEALFKLAEAYEMAANYQKAIEWYQVIDSKVSDSQLKTEIRKRIDQLEKEKEKKGQN